MIDFWQNKLLLENAHNFVCPKGQIVTGNSYVDTLPVRKASDIKMVIS